MLISPGPENLDDLHSKDLIPFFLKFIKTHTYFRTRNIAIDYLLENTSITTQSEEYKKYSQKLACQIGKLISILKEVNLIESSGTLSFKVKKGARNLNEYQVLEYYNDYFINRNFR